MSTSSLAPRGFALFALLIALAIILAGAGYWYWAVPPPASISPTPSIGANATTTQDQSTHEKNFPRGQSVWSIATTTLELKKSGTNTWITYTNLAGFSIAFPDWLMQQDFSDTGLSMFYQSPKDSTPTITLVVGSSKIEDESILGNSIADVIHAANKLASSTNRHVSYTEQMIGGFDTVQVNLTGWTVDIGGGPSTELELWFATPSGLVSIWANGDANQTAPDIFSTLKKTQ